MTIRCSICNILITEPIDILDNKKALRDASARLMQHIQQTHPVHLQGLQRVTMQAMVLVTWILTMQNFCIPLLEDEQEVNEVMQTMENDIVNLLRGTAPVAETPKQVQPQ